MEAVWRQYIVTDAIGKYNVNSEAWWGGVGRRHEEMSMGVVLDPEGTETRVICDLVDFANKDVLDVGCGDGRMTWRFAASTRSVLGLDPLAESITAARAATPAELQTRVRFEVANITDTELPCAAFDVAVFSWSLC